MKNKVYTVPDAASGFTFTLEPPYGVEFIKIIASTEQFKNIETSLAELGKTPQALITRGLAVKGRQAQSAEVTLNYTIVEKK